MLSLAFTSQKDIVINKRDYKDYFTTGVMQFKVQQLAITETTGKYDAKINVTWWYDGPEAARLAISSYC